MNLFDVLLVAGLCMGAVILISILYAFSKMEQIKQVPRIWNFLAVSFAGYIIYLSLFVFTVFKPITFGNFALLLALVLFLSTLFLFLGVFNLWRVFRI